MKKLDLGCGKHKEDGCVGVDFVKLDTVDVAHDLNSFPYPFKDDEFDIIYCNHVLEHLQNVTKVMEELYRISSHNGKIFVRVPHASCPRTCWTDPTHIRPFCIDSFSYFSKKSNFSYYTDINIGTEKVELHYCLYNGILASRKITKIPLFIIKVINFFANYNRYSQLIFERFLANYVGGFEEVYFVLEVKKI